jgi:hypothetical protein
MAHDPFAARDKLLQLLDGVEAFDAIAAMLFATYAGYPSSGDGQPRIAAQFGAEYAVMHLLRRGTVEPRRTSSEPVLVEELVTWSEAAAAPEGLRDYGDGDPDDPTGMETDVHRRFAAQQIAIYDPVVPDLEAQRWPRLFAPEEEALERVTGLRIEAVQRMTEFLLLRSMGWCLHHAGVDRDKIEGTRYLAVLREAVLQGQGRVIEPGAGRVLACSREAFARGAMVSLEQVERFLELFAIGPGAESDEPFKRFVWALRRRPVIEWDGQIVVPVPFNLTTALRPTLETALRAGDFDAGDRYDRHKGKWVERQALRLLGDIMSPEQGYRALKVSAGGPGLKDPEHDGLLVVDAVAFAVEAKGGGVALAARRGNVDSQDKVFRRLIHEGVQQADGLIAALQEGTPVTGVDLESDQRVHIDIGSIRRWVPLVATLEDMSGVIATYQVTFADRERGRPHPVVLTLDDIAWIARELPLPAQFVHYMIVRGRIARSSARLVMYDETDWLGLYYAGGGAGTQELLDKLARRETVVLAGGRSGRRGVLSPRLQPWTTPFSSVLERWNEEREDGWLAASMAVLDLSASQANELRSALGPVRQRAIEENDKALLTYIPQGDPSVAVQVVVWDGVGTLDISDFAALFLDTAPDAQEHTFLLALSDELDDLQLLGVVEVPDGE